MNNRFVLFAITSGIGGIIMLIYFGVIPWSPSRHCNAVFCDPYHWQILSLGITFCLVGCAFLIPPRMETLVRLCTLAILCSFGAAMIGTIFFA